MKSVLISIQPYWVFLIIARLMGWSLQQEKTVEVRKNFPKDLDWNKVAHIYCSKNRKSFNRIPKEYQPFMEKLLGCVIGEFVCARISQLNSYCLDGEDRLKDNTCLDDAELMDYVGYLDKTFYLWHISDLKIYDTPKELWEFSRFGFKRMGYSDCICANEACKYREKQNNYFDPPLCIYRENGQSNCQLNRPPQSWCYV